MKKIFIFGLPIITLLLVVGAYLYFSQPNDVPVVTPGSGLPSANGTQPSGATITPVVIKGADGRGIRVKDFSASATEDPYNKGNFYLHATDGNTSYQIEYI